MREIKFEIKIKNLRSNAKEHNGNEYSTSVYTLDELLGRNGCLYNPQVEEIVYKRQYTGLKDKNGKEIYEGDIVRFSDKAEWYLNDIFAKRLHESADDVRKWLAEQPYETRVVEFYEGSFLFCSVYSEVER